MNLKFSPTTTPAGSRFLYRSFDGHLLEGTIREWSKTGKYLNWNGEWMSLKDTNQFTLIEVLTNDDVWTSNKYK